MLQVQDAECSYEVKQAGDRFFQVSQGESKPID